jgi:RimJ/RimL family protein N-acetyltransferase
MVGDECQLVTLHAFVPFAGIGTRLIEAVRKAALDGGCRRLWLVTTNDNLDALRFYQRRGFSLVAVHRGLRDVARRLKPEIPVVGAYGIPIRDEVELEMLLSRRG